KLISVRMVAPGGRCHVGPVRGRDHRTVASTRSAQGSMPATVRSRGLRSSPPCSTGEAVPRLRSACRAGEVAGGEAPLDLPVDVAEGPAVAGGEVDELVGGAQQLARNVAQAQAAVGACEIGLAGLAQQVVQVEVVDRHRGLLLRPFPLDQTWVWEDEPELTGERVDRKLATYTDGVLNLGTDGCALCYMLVVTGTERGNIWSVADVGACSEGRASRRPCRGAQDAAPAPQVRISR